ncbi:basic phospholipase A2 nigexine isoform X2 [Nematostella vectensis]|uniref:basic phospholipase A2 nigexine isoform X2 n=1 Tax=Nematostella vectensis TaxID=45351 RepID=UPI0020775443|nr:basic phospholipase A2 nigexine isoform X2 [Nematostella vectensis]
MACVKSASFLLLFFAFLTISTDSRKTARDRAHNIRRRRSLFQLANMMKCLIPQRPWTKCCQAHDTCYDKVSSNYFCGFPGAIYFAQYRTLSSRNMPGCLTCDKSNDSCHMLLCSCDVTLVKCLANKKLNKQFISYRKTKCFETQYEMHTDQHLQK